MSQSAFKVALLNPPGGRKVPLFENLGIGYLAAILRKHTFAVTVVDAIADQLATETVVDEVIRAGPDLLGISTTQPTYGNVLKIVSALRKKWTGAICIGGHLPTFYDDRILEETSADFVVRGEGEYPFLELAEMLFSGLTRFESIPNLTFRSSGGVVRNPLRKRILNLDDLPHPSRDTIAKVVEKGSWVGVSSSRGCNGHCTFCTVNRFYESVNGSAWVGRSAASVVNEIESLFRDHGARKIMFVDDNFLGNAPKARKRAYEIAAMIIGRDLDIRFGFACRADAVDVHLFARLVAAGLDWVFIGFESGSVHALKRFGKSIGITMSLSALDTLRNMAVKVEPGFIMFDPETSIQDILNNLTFLEKIPDSFLFSNLSSKLEVLCGSGYSQRFIGRLEHGSNYSSIPYEFPEGVGQVYRDFCHLVEAIDHSDFESIHEEIKEKSLILTRKKVVPISLSTLLQTKLATIKAKYISLFRFSLEHSTQCYKEYVSAVLERWLSHDVRRLAPLKENLAMISDHRDSAQAHRLVSQIEAWMDQENTDFDQVALERLPKIKDLLETTQKPRSH